MSSNQNNKSSGEEQREIPIHGDKALNQLEGETVEDVSREANGIAILTESGKYKFQSLTEEVFVELWEED